jgi:hypothetical protein
MGRLPKVRLNNDAPTDDKNAEKTQLPALRDTTNELDNKGYSEFEGTNMRVHLRLNTIGNTRRSMARVLRAVDAGKISHEEGRSYAYMLLTQSNLFKTEMELGLQKQIDELKRMIQELQNNGGGTP